MRRSPILRLPLLCIAAVSVVWLCGCAEWTRTSGLYTNSDEAFSIATPPVWYEKSLDDGVMLSRYGMDLQGIVVVAQQYGDSLPGSSRTFAKNMMLHELAQCWIDWLISRDDLYNLAITSNTVIMVDGRSAAELVYTFTESSELRMRSTTILVPYENRVCILDYTGASRYYYKKTHKEFLDLVASFRAQ